MGEPVATLVGGRTVYVCRGGCAKQAQADPAKTLAAVGPRGRQVSAAPWPHGRGKPGRPGDELTPREPRMVGSELLSVGQMGSES